MITLFHFALQKDGILLLGTSETVGHVEGQFKPVAKSERIYRRIGKNRTGALLFSSNAGDGVRVPMHRIQAVSIEQEPEPEPALAELCRRAVLDNLAPAAVMINRDHECLYSMGPTERYLRVIHLCLTPPVFVGCMVRLDRPRHWLVILVRVG